MQVISQFSWSGPLYEFGLLNLIGTFLMFGLSFIDKRKILGESPWVKPIKFALSVWLFAWTLSFIFQYYYEPHFFKTIEFWIILFLSIEMVLIILQATRGVRSHFNNTTWYDGAIYSVMGLVITLHTFLMGYVAYRYWIWDGMEVLEPATLWGIRLGLVFFVIFSFEGFAMGRSNKHTVGGDDGGKGLRFFNWSRKAGDLRVAHFFGLHSLQVMPLVGIVSVGLFPSFAIPLTLLGCLSYAFLSGYLFIQALRGKPFLPFLN